MARTLGQMKAIALDMADVTGDPHIVADRLTDWFNLELAALADLLVSSDENYFCTRKTIPLRAGVGTYDLPRNFYHALKIWHVPNPNTMDDRRPMARLTFDELGGNQRAAGDRLRYMLVGGEQGTQLVLSRPDTAGAVELWYVPQFAELQSDDSRVSPAIPNGFEDWVMLGVAVRCRVKEESDTTQLEAKRGEVLSRITALMSQRDHGESLQVGDYYASHGHPRHGADYAGWDF